MENGTKRPKNPLAEVFGFPADNLSPEAIRHRTLRLCPFGNIIPNCTKDKANNPLGVCSIFDNEKVVITCPVRFRESWLIAEDAASFFFSKESKWTSLSEVRLKDANGKSAGNIDIVLVSYDESGRVTDFGALEVQAVYISGNMRNPFERYMINHSSGDEFDWGEHANYPNPDYLSSSRKRLAPQLIFKGGIFQAWNKKLAVALNRGFFETLPKFGEVEPIEANIAWLVYDIEKNQNINRFVLHRHKIIFAKFDESLEKITRSMPGDINVFINHLQKRINHLFENSTPPDNEKIDAPF